MPKGPSGPTSWTTNQVHQLENKVNKLRWINNDLNKQVFDAVQRGHRLAAKLGYQNLEEAEEALATQQPGEAQSQIEQLSQHPPDELASHVHDLQAELINHVQLSKSTLAALGDALQEMTELREENSALRSQLEKATKNKAKEKNASTEDASEVDFLRAELAALKKQYADLQRAKDKNDQKHHEDFKLWKSFKDWLMGEKRQELQKESERPAKRRKLSPSDDGGAKENGDLEPISPERLPRADWDNHFGGIQRRLQAKMSRKTTGRPARSASPAPASRRDSKPSVLSSRNLNSPSRRASSSPAAPASSSTLSNRPAVKRLPSLEIPQDDLAASSETEPESQPVTFILPSQLDVTVPSTVPQKRRRSPLSEHDSSETEQESQAPTFMYPSQISPDLPTDMTPKPHPAVRRAGQLWTPISVARPQQASKGKREAGPEGKSYSRSESASADPFRLTASTPAPREMKIRLPDTPASLGPKKGKERMTEDDKENGEGVENGVPSASAGPSRTRALDDYTPFKGRGRYGEELKAGKDNINALYELDPARNDGVPFQYDEVVRDKRRRKHMHAADCECCRDYYEAVGPLPPRTGGPVWRSPVSTPSKRDSFEDDEIAAAAIEEHKQAISRHRQHWPRAKTPPKYWNIGFPDTQEVAAMNAEAARMHDEKRRMIAEEAE
ncbi:DNA repair protein endonuclease SAE2/CtIP C-terminus-domain-containing protein [Cubamyces menziesii]|nr:DNA repair protein endonuclease SAE2/CtIP C-terminus-domain-containing protein [Cubamyces menziesii]